MKLPEDTQQQARWQTAVENLIKAAENGGGWLMFARIAMLRALNADDKALTRRDAAGRRLFQRRIHRREFGVQLGSDAVDGSDDRDAMPQAIRQYSIAVAPDSIAKNLESSCRIQKLLSTPRGFSRAHAATNLSRLVASVLMNSAERRLRRHELSRVVRSGAPTVRWSEIYARCSGRLGVCGSSKCRRRSAKELYRRS